jgi:hypothetical protein
MVASIISPNYRVYTYFRRSCRAIEAVSRVENSKNGWNTDLFNAMSRGKSPDRNDGLDVLTYTYGHIQFDNTGV